MKRHLLLTIVDGFHYRYLVQTGIYEHLLQKSDKLVVCATDPVLDLLRARGEEQVVLARLAKPKTNSKTGVHLFLRSCASRRLSSTLNIKAEQQRTQFPWRYRLRRWLGGVIGITRFDPSHWFESAWYDKSVDHLIREHTITLVVLSTPGQKLEDLPYLESARRKGIRTISPVYSWDNLTAKGPFVIPPDQLVVWNDVMKQEAIHFHGYMPDDILVGGVPVFDPYAEIRKASAEASRRQDFLMRLGLNPSKRLITLTTIPPVYYGSCHRDLVVMLKGWISTDKLHNVSLLIRPHPMDSTDYQDLVGPDVVLDNYGSEPNADPRQWKPSEDNTSHLGWTMAISDVVVNIASTITVDAACFDTPCINVAFDIKPHGNEYEGSVARYYNYTHYRLVVETGAVTIVESPDAFLDALNSYLADSFVGCEGRAMLLSKQVGALDGQAWWRTANAILGAREAC